MKDWKKKMMRSSYDIEKEKTTFRWLVIFNFQLLLSSGIHLLLPYPLLYHMR